MADFTGADHTNTYVDGSTAESSQSAAGKIRKNGAGCISLHSLLWSVAGKQRSVGGRGYSCLPGIMVGAWPVCISGLVVIFGQDKWIDDFRVFHKMTKIDRYIKNQVLLAMLVVLFVLAGLDLVFALVDEIGETDANYSSIDAMRYVLFIFPRHIYELLPMTALIGSLVGLGILASANELMILQASGVKVLRIVWAVMKPAIIVMVVGLLLGEFVAPKLELQGELDRALARGEQVALSRYGHWQRDRNEFMHFNAIDPDGVLHGISIYSFTEQKTLAAQVNAESARFQKDSGGFWLLDNGTEITYTNTQGQAGSQVNVFAEKKWDVDLNPDLLKVLIIEPDKMSISDLYRYARRFENQGQDGSAYFLSFWKKILQPLTTAALVIVAVSFIFGPLRSATMGSKVFTAICFGIVFYLFQNLLSTVSLVYQLNPLFAAGAPIFFCLLMGAALLRRAS